jgi:hypothetical protein
MGTLTRRSGVYLAQATAALALVAAAGCSTGADDAPAGPAHTVSVTASGPGTVTSSPAGLACGHGGTCAFGFVEGTQVILTATPDPGSAFAGWTGACAGSGSCSFPVTSGAGVGATFAPLELLTVTVSGAGSVTSSPAGLACAPGTCVAPFASGSEVTLTATPASGWTFAGWSDACAGTGACVVSLSAPSSVVATFSPSAEGAITFQGWVTYDFVPATYDPVNKTGTLSFASASVKPVRKAVVRVRDGATLLATGTTDVDGYYTLTFFPGAATTVSLEALARTTAPAIQVEDNTDGNAVWAVGATMEATSGRRDLHATHGWTGTTYDPPKRIAAPFAILDSMYTAAKGFLDIPRAVPFPPLKVNWSPENSPSSTYDPASGAIVTSHYAPWESEIYVLGKADVDTDEFDAHVIVHEWGHFFEAKLSRADSPGGPHGLGDVLDPRLAFGEGYGSALAAMLLPRPIYADTYWTPKGFGAFGWDSENVPSPTDDYDAEGLSQNPGPFSEMSIIRLLYDLFDAGTNEAWDTVSVGLGPIYDVLVGPQRTTPALTTIGSFIAPLKAHPDVDPEAVDALLAHYGIGRISDAWGTGDPNLRAIYTDVSLPHDSNVTLRGDDGVGNERRATQYFVISGTGKYVTVSAFSSADVRLTVHRAGTPVAFADAFLGNAKETVTFSTVEGTKYVVVLTGFAPSGASFEVSVSASSL